MAWHPLRNFGLKFAALALGILLWLTVTGELVERKVTRVPIFYRNLGSGLEITDQPESVDVSIRGNQGLIGALQAGEISVMVDLQGRGPGANVFLLQAAHVNVPIGIEVTHIDPASLQVWLEREVSAPVPVRPMLEGEPAAGYVVKQMLVEPASVVLVGPESRLKTGTEAVTERVRIDGATASVNAVVNVAVEDSQLHLREPQTARVTVVIERAPIERVYQNRGVQFRNLARGRRAEAAPATVAIALRGTADAFKALDPGRIVPYVDVAGQGPGRYNLQVRVDLGREFVVAAITPPTIAVRIR
jgi:YbbR domain-containing protein